MTKAKAISPAEASQAKLNAIPDEVIEVVNEMLSSKYSSERGYVTLMQKSVSKAIATRLNISTDEVFDRHLLDFEEIYIRAGWIVTYDKPAYNETYEASWEFRASK